MLHRISKLRTTHHTLRLPKLIGIVVLQDSVVGFLEEYIPGCEQLQKKNVEQIRVSERQKWNHQIQEAVHLLHENDAIWGDAKAHNVLIDESGNA